MFNLADKRIIITGGGGFRGRHVIARLRERGVPEANLSVPRRHDYDLTNLADCARLYREAFPGKKADLVMPLAAEVGGIGANRASPGRYFYANMAMALHLIEQARAARGVGRGREVAHGGARCGAPR